MASTAAREGGFCVDREEDFRREHAMAAGEYQWLGRR
jgi:hypothetical protein